MNKELYEKIEQINARSARMRGVKEQALEMVEQAEVKLTRENAKEVLLNGALNWSDYSYGGNALIYDEDIAERYCSPSELKKKGGGRLQPNSRETWLDLQARALEQAYSMIRRNIK